MNHKDFDDWTPLHLPGMAEVARVLLEYGANVGAKDKQGKTPLHRAADGGDFHNRLEANAKYRKFDVARVLLERGASVDAEDNEGRTPLHAAAVHCNFKIVHLLLEHGANVDVVDSQGATPLLVAVEFPDREAESERVEVLRVLLEHGASVGAKDNQGRAAFQVALASGVDGIMKLLSEYGANCQGHVEA
jgi:ankyrin repeat protein